MAVQSLVLGIEIAYTEKTTIKDVIFDAAGLPFAFDPQWQKTSYKRTLTIDND